MKSKSNNFFLGKTNKSIKAMWEKRLKESQVLAKNNPSHGITWSPTINWHGFVRHLAYAKTLDGKILHMSSAESMVTLTMDAKATYMSQTEFNEHNKKIQPFLQRMPSILGTRYWKH